MLSPVLLDATYPTTYGSLTTPGAHGPLGTFGRSEFYCWDPAAQLCLRIFSGPFQALSACPLTRQKDWTQRPSTRTPRRTREPSREVETREGGRSRGTGASPSPPIIICCLLSSLLQTIWPGKHGYSLPATASTAANRNLVWPRQLWPPSTDWPSLTPLSLSLSLSLTPTRTTRWSETMLTAPFTRGYVSDLADIALSLSPAFSKIPNPKPPSPELSHRKAKQGVVSSPRPWSERN